MLTKILESRSMGDRCPGRNSSRVPATPVSTIAMVTPSPFVCCQARGAPTCSTTS